MMRQVPAAIQALERGWNCSTNIHSKRVAPVSDEERGRRAAERAEKRAAARRLMQQRPPRRVHVEAKPWNGSTKTDSKRVDPATPAQRDQQGLLRMAERQARTLRLQAPHGVTFQPTTKWNASTRVTSQEVVVARPRVEPLMAVLRPRAPLLVYMYIWNDSTNLHKEGPSSIVDGCPSASWWCTWLAMDAPL
ncbi:hypothetical protein H257_10845 [Aphanomyces astaci]|uniref:Uncharacterized protein n=1 Tax=Aphanomyces astaci TaxID=112090 RepID=W4G654_APHAT|nr:hypothetical protein H257_10845 [Aphanomyces astaci]ETV74766.1 hypothetical protein H257_10845 [Aphanomyces astaci]|eukprot:XP_009835853.1 hypothetical protein H257_10845 [Aphanomyces astaci]